MAEGTLQELPYSWGLPYQGGYLGKKGEEEKEQGECDLNTQADLLIR